MKKQPKQATQLIGISYENLIQLIAIAKKMNENYQKHLSEQKIRLIRPGGGAKHKLLVEDRILLSLMYLRQGLTFQVLYHFEKSPQQQILSEWDFQAPICSNLFPKWY